MDGRFRASLIGVTIAVFGILWCPQKSVAEERAPLLIEGKTALYQRVLTRPGAKMHSEPTPRGGEQAPSVSPFSVYYVYDRKVIQDQGWVEVGPKSRGGTLGWLPTDATIDWKQTMTAAFTPRVGRERALFFRGDDELIDLLESELMLPTIEEQRAAIKAGDVPDDFPVIALEPANYVDFNEQFYLLPILSAEEVWLDSGFTARLLEVASVPETEGSEQDLADPEVRQRAIEEVGDESNEITDFAAAIAFVMDTTISMGPYIDRSREVIRSIYEAIEADDLLPKVSFALVGFRDEIKERPEVEYVAKDARTGRVMFSSTG
jgi:serine/threonine-protein kinase PpkA